MDKFAVLQLKKKKAREEEMRRLGMVAGDAHAPVKLTDAEKDEINKAFGYPSEPTEVNCVCKYTPPNGLREPAVFAAAIWWSWVGDWVDPKKREEEERAAIAKAEAEREAAVAAAQAAAAAAAAAAKRGQDSPSRKLSMFGGWGSAKVTDTVGDGPFRIGGGGGEGDEDEEEGDDLDWSSVSLKSKKYAAKEKKPKLTKKEKLALLKAEEDARLALENLAKQEAFEKEQRETEARAKFLVGWEIARYKREAPGLAGSGDAGGWKYKGSINIDARFEGGRLKMQTLLVDLGENCEYRFTVRAVNGRGRGKESPPSNSIMVERDLPSGWFRFFDESLGRQYYANIKTGQSAWGRPDADPFFLDETIMLTFNKEEIKHLRALFYEEHEHFRAVFRQRFHELLRECGERMSNFRVYKLFKGYAGGLDTIESYQVYMDVMMHIKKKKMAMSLEGMAQAGARARLLMRQQLVASLLSTSDKEKYRNWQVQYSHIAEREYYVSVQTKKKQWELPDELRFYLPRRLEQRMLSAFDFGHIEVFKQYFAILDVDCTGEVSDKELRLFLDALAVDIDDEGFKQLVMTVDLNGNGTIGFDEFCWMIFELARADSKSALAGVSSSLGGGGGGGGGGGFNMDLQQLSANLASLKARSLGADAAAGQMLAGATIGLHGEIQPPVPGTVASASAAAAAVAAPSVDAGPSSPSIKQTATARGGTSTKQAAGSPSVKFNLSPSTRTAPAPASDSVSAGSPSFKASSLKPAPPSPDAAAPVSASASPSAAVAAVASSPAATALGSTAADGEAKDEGRDGRSVSSSHGEGAGAGAGVGEGEDQEQGDEEEQEQEEEWVDEVVEEEEDSPDARHRELQQKPPEPSGLALFIKALWNILHPNAVAASKAAAEAKAAEAQRKAERIAERQRKNRERDAGSAHGPYCFCGCRSF